VLLLRRVDSGYYSAGIRPDQVVYFDALPAFIHGRLTVEDPQRLTEY
jgi:hypothetical protein